MEKLSNKSIKAEDMRAFCRGEYAVNCQTKEDADMFLNICAEHLNISQQTNGKWDYSDFGPCTCFYVKDYKNPILIWCTHMFECGFTGKVVKQFESLIEEEIKEISIPKKSRKIILSEFETKELIAEIYRRSSNGRYEL